MWCKLKYILRCENSKNNLQEFYNKIGKEMFFLFHKNVLKYFPSPWLKTLMLKLIKIEDVEIWYIGNLWKRKFSTVKAIISRKRLFGHFP